MSIYIAPFRRKVGWFVLLGLASIIVVLMLVGVRSDLFADKFRLAFSPPSATGFYVGQPVRLQGFIVGRVDGMRLQSDGSVRIELAMLERYRLMLHRPAHIELGRDGLIGEQLLQISGGNAALPPLVDGEQIAYRSGSTVEQLLKDVRPAVENANKLLARLTELAGWLNDPESDLRQLTARLNRASRNLGDEDLGHMLQSMQKTLTNLEVLSADLKEQRVARQLSESLKVTSRILAHLEPISRELSRQGPESVRRIESLIEHVDKLSASLDIVASDMSELTPELPGLARESRQTIRQMRDTLNQLQNSWLIGGGKAGETGVPTSDKVAPEPVPMLEMRP